MTVTAMTILMLVIVSGFRCAIPAAADKNTKNNAILPLACFFSPVWHY